MQEFAVDFGGAILGSDEIFGRQMVHAGPQGALRTSEIQLKKEAPEKAVRQRDPDGTKARILEAAKREFAKLGFGGARVDSIAARAKANKRMIYHYFTSKEELFTAVLEEAYLAIRAAERKLSLESLEPEAALESLFFFSWKNFFSKPA